MKKLLVVLMSVIIVLTFSVNIFANEEDKGEYIFNDQYGFSVYEYVDSDNRTVRTYSKKDNKDVRDNSTYAINVISNDDYQATKQLLLTLGMEESDIMQLSQASLEKYSVAQNVVSVTSYTKSDVDGNVVYVSEEEAIEKTNEILAIQSNPNTNETATETSEDSYMKISLFTTYLGNGNYYFSADAKWFTMPNNRSTDSFGICLNGHTINLSSCFAWIEYDKIPYSVLGSKIIHQSEGLLSSSYSYPTSGNWRGFAAAFDLKNDWFMGDSFTNYEVHIEFDSAVEYPEQSLNFNVVATYHHSEKTVDIDGVSIGIDTSGSVGASIGIVMDKKYTRRYAYSSNPYYYEGI